MLNSPSMARAKSLRYYKNRILVKLNGLLIPEFRRHAIIKHFSGSGIELGALHRPVDAPHLNVKYVDRFSTEDLRKQYPELNDKKLVHVDIVDDAESLECIQDQSQDFVIANHLIEHMPNPIKALLTWQRVLKPRGRLLLSAPDKRVTFDEDRELTSIEHLLDDYNNPSHARDFEAFKDFALKVSCRYCHIRPEKEADELARELWEQNYSIHYHVWDYRRFNNFLNYLSEHFDNWHMKVIDKLPTIKDRFVFVLERTSDG